MVILYSPNPMQIDLLSYRMDLVGVAYEIKQSETNEYTLVVDGVPLDFERALKWIESRDNNGN